MTAQVTKRGGGLLSVQVAFKEENTLCWNFPRGDFWPKKGGGSYRRGTPYQPRLRVVSFGFGWISLVWVWFSLGLRGIFLDWIDLVFFFGWLTWAQFWKVLTKKVWAKKAKRTTG